MQSDFDYLLAKILSLVFYIITLVIYNQARKEYIGGKIAAAINLVMVSLVIFFLADFMDYFSRMLLSVNQDTVLIVKIVLRLSAMCVLFFGGLRFFVSPSAVRTEAPKTTPSSEIIETDITEARASGTEKKNQSTVILDKPIGEPEETPPDRPTLGRYEILGQIGKGAMGVVYKGKDSKLQRLTAIKTIRFGDDFNDEQVDDIKKQFYHEAEMVAGLSHPNIVAIYDIGEDLDLSYLAMEYLDGESLDQYRRKNKHLTARECINIIIQVCDALEYAHGRNIVHRDIKPANIMILENGVVKVTDFGVARSISGSQTRTGVVKGTPYYMSPEQAKGEKVTGASDIFALGVVFYQLLTGKLPFTGESLAAIMYQTMTVDPVSAAKHNPKIGQKMLVILNRALEKKRQDRYETAGKMADDLWKLVQKKGPRDPSS
jgi:tRNA A-37 threonylcarbamoyl transferase component Bud32